MKKARATGSTRVLFECLIEREQKDGLDKLSEETGAPKAELVRRAIRDYLSAKRTL